MVACQREATTDREAITIDAVIDSSEDQTRSPQYDSQSGIGTFQQGDQIGLYIQQSLSGVVRKANLLHVVLSQNAPYYWDDFGAPKLHFFAYYPKAETIDDYNSYLFDASGDIPTHRKDLLLSSHEIDYPLDELTMQFRHSMHKIVVKLRSSYYGNAALAGATVSVYAKERAKVDLETSTAAEDSSAPVNTVASTEQFNDSASGTFARTFIVAPQTVASAAKLLRVSIDGAGGDKVNYNYSLAEALTLESGKCLTITMEITKTGLSILSGDIAAWGEQDPLDATPDIDIPED